MVGFQEPVKYYVDAPCPVFFVDATAEYWLPPWLIDDYRFLITDFVIPAVIPGML